MPSKHAPDSPAEPAEEPLPLTLRFVFAIGGVFLVGWFLMFALLSERW